MSFAGGLFGAIIGSMLGGPLGAIVGGVVGNLLTSNTRQQVFPKEEFFACLGKLAKSDGRVSEEEAAFVREIMNSMNLDTGMKEKLNEAFRSGRDSKQPFTELCQDFVKKLDKNDLREAMTEPVLNIFCSLVIIDRTIDPEEKKLLYQAESLFGVRGFVDNFFAQNTMGGSGPGPQENTLEDAYKLLEIAPSATDAEVKKAWHEKVRKYHPDRVQGAGFNAEFIEKAKLKMQEINNAYETIMKSRS